MLFSLPCAGPLPSLVSVQFSYYIGSLGATGRIPMADYPYRVTSPSGEIVLQAAESCRYPRLVELTLLEAGYTVRLHGKKITKTETRKEMRK